MIPERKWKWFGHAGHFCVGHLCRFHLATKVGKFFVSTVGDFYQEDKRQTIGAGSDSFFETYVFRVLPGKKCTDTSCQCGIPNIDLSEIDGVRHATAGLAAACHMEKCREYAFKQRG